MMGISIYCLVVILLQTIHAQSLLSFREQNDLQFAVTDRCVFDGSMQVMTAYELC
jgi:hypothetical protein